MPNPRLARPGVVALILAGAPLLAAERSYPLRYQYTLGETLTYETRTVAEGRMTLKSETGPPRALPMAMEITDRTVLRVGEARDDGTCWLAMRLQRLRLASSGVGGGLVFELEDGRDGVRVRSGNRTWLVRRGQPAPADSTLAPGFTARDAADLTEPAKLRLSATGQVLAQQGKTWRQRLAGVALMGSLAPLVDPFGSLLPELPGRALTPGTQWEQERRAVLPGSTDTYALRVSTQVAQPQTVGPYETIGIALEGSARCHGVDFTFQPTQGRPMAMTLDALTHDLTGRTALDYQRGRLVEQRLLSQVHTTSSGKGTPPFTLEADVKVDASMLLLSIGEGGVEAQD